MKKIFKYKLNLEERQQVDLPKGAKILSVQAQRDEISLWALVDPNEKEADSVGFAIVGTGNPINFNIQDAKFLETIQFEGGHFVFHVFRTF